MKRKWMLRWSVFILGLMVLAFGISLTIKGKFLGIGPWDVFHYGLFTKFGFTIGTWSIISGLLLLFISSVFNKAWPQIGSFLNMMLLGLFIDLFNWMLPSIDNLAGATIAFIIGVVLMGYGIGLYVSADFGAGPRDSFMLKKKKKMGWSIPLVRNGIEIIVFLIGWMLGGPVGIGTLFIAFGLGPILGFSIPQCKKLMAYILDQKDQFITT